KMNGRIISGTWASMATSGDARWFERSTFRRTRSHRLSLISSDGFMQRPTCAARHKTRRSVLPIGTHGASARAKTQKTGARPAFRYMRRSAGKASAFLRLQHLTAAIHAGLQVDVVRAAKLAGVLVLDIGRGLQRVGGTAHA